MVIRRGELWWAKLPSPADSGPGYRRPVVIIQANPFNESKIATVIVAVVTSNLRLEAAPGNVRLPVRVSSLPKPSVVNVSQLVTLDKCRLRSRIRALPDATLQQVDDGVRLVLGLR